MHHRIYRTVYRFGSMTHGHYGHVALHRDGVVRYYQHRNERRFEFDGERLHFIGENGARSSSLRFCAEANCFLPDDRHQMYLLPIVELQGSGHDGTTGSLLLNTVPKSGTYLLEEAARLAGFTPLRLHLGAFVCHDNRGIPEQEIHVAPWNRALNVPAGALAHIMGRGEVAVGHIENDSELDYVVASGTTLLHAVRDLRDVLVSLYRFKRRVVAPLSPADAAWRSLPEPEGFIGFLVHFAERDVLHIAQIARTIAARGEARLHFESFAAGDQALVPAVPTLGDEFPATMAETIRACRGKATATFSGTPTDYRDIWCPAAQTFFEDSGLAEINQILGYE